MDEREKKRILGYDVEALKKNIRKHESNIVIFSQAVEDAKNQVKLLQSYIDLIKQEKGRA